MAHFAVHISTDGAAFAGEGRNAELARILRDLADALDEGAPEGAFFKRLRDVNGNRVGFASAQAAEEEHDESEHALDDDADAYFDRA